MGRWHWFPPSPSGCSDAKESDVPHVSWQRDTLSDYCIGRPTPTPELEQLVDFAIRNEPRERERDELERHVDTFSDELELVEPTSLGGRFVQSLRNGGALHPQSYWHLAWLLLVSAGFMYNCITIPLRSTFPYQTPSNWGTWFVFDTACDVVYLLDLVLVKPHVIFVYDGFWVRDKRLTRKHYFAKWQFKLDILSLTPLDLLYLKYGTENVLFRLPRILKIQTFWELFDHLDSLLMSPYLVRVARTLCYMMFLVHLNACGYYAFSAREGLGANNWTYRGGDGNAYIRCFYFATKTATSVGKNPRPETEGEYLFMTCSWLMGVFVFALLIGQIRDIVATASRTRTEHRKRLDETLEHMRGLSLPDHVQRRVQSWFTFADQHQPFDEGKILNSLPQKLKTDVAIDVHGGTLAKVTLFNKITDPALIRDLVLKLRSVLYLPGDFICRKNEVGKEMYIVKTGQVEVLAPTNGEVLATLGEGSVFGEISLLALAGGNRRTADVRSKGFSNLFVLSKNDLHETLVYYPDAQKVLKQKAEALMQENADRERRENHLARGSPTTSQEAAEDTEDDSDGTVSSAGNAESEEEQAESPQDEPQSSSLQHNHHPMVMIKVTPELSPPPPERAVDSEAVVVEAVPDGVPDGNAVPTAWAYGPDATDTLLPSVHVTQATDHDSDLTDVTCASLTSRTSRSSASRCSRSSRCSRRGSCCSSCCGTTCSCTCRTCSSRACEGTACTATATETGPAAAPSLPWADDVDDADDADDADTLSDLSSASLLSPLLSPTHEWARSSVATPTAPTPTATPAATPTAPPPRDLQRRRVSAPATTTDTADGPRLAPHRLSFPSSRRKLSAMTQRSNQ